MRQLIALVPRGEGSRAMRIAQEQEGTNLACLPAKGVDREQDLVLIHAPNERIERLLGELQEIEGLKLTLTPQGIIALKPPASEAPDQVIDVSERSPIEVFLGGLQSVGSWKGFLGYAAAAGIVVWIGLHTNTVFLLTAAMLIAPFAGPAMTMALGTARGDRMLIGRSLLRYVASLITCILMAWVLSQATGQEIATEMMVQISLLSSITVLLPLTAGAAGALNLCQSERNSLVTAAGTGMLVAASLAPPAGLIGMSAAIGEWDLAKSGAFVLLLQLVGINLSGAIVFWTFGLTPRGVRYDRGKNWVRWVSLAASGAAVGILLTWQFWTQPDLLRATRSQRIAKVVQETVDQSHLGSLVQSEVRFTRANVRGQDSLLVIAYVQRSGQPEVDRDDAAAALSRLLSEEISSRFKVTPLVDVTILRP